MWIGLAAAVLLVLLSWQGMREFRSLALYGAAHSALSQGRKDLAVRLYSRLIDRPFSLVGKKLRNEARFRLSWIKMDSGQYEEAVELLRAMLATKPPLGVEVNVRRRLSEALTGAGHPEEAKEEQGKVVALLSRPNATLDLTRERTRAQLLHSQQRFQECLDVCEAMLTQIPVENEPERAKTLLQMALASFNLGRSEKVVVYCEEALRFAHNRDILISIHNIFSLGLNGLNRLEEAEQHRRISLELSIQTKNPNKIAQSKSLLAGSLLANGKIAEAMQLTQEALPLTIDNRRSIYVQQFEILKVWGRFQEAQEVLTLAQKAHGIATPSAEERMQSVFQCAKADINAELGEAEEALRFIDEGLVGLANDLKLCLEFRALRAWILAQLGREAEALSERDWVLQNLQAYKDENKIQHLSLCHLGRCMLALGRQKEGEEHWRRYLELKPYPVYQPDGWRFLGEVLQGQGDIEGARGCYERAVASGLDTYSCRQAARLLQALPANSTV